MAVTLEKKGNQIKILRRFWKKEDKKITKSALTKVIWICDFVKRFQQSLKIETWNSIESLPTSERKNVEYFKLCHLTYCSNGCEREK